MKNQVRVFFVEKNKVAKSYLETFLDFLIEEGLKENLINEDYDLTSKFNSLKNKK